MNRRSFLLGLAAGLAPAVIRTPGLLMPVKALAVADSVTLVFARPAAVGAHWHWFNDRPGRIEEAISSGYKLVRDLNGEPVTRTVGGDQLMRAVLLVRNSPVYAPIVEG